MRVAIVGAGVSGLVAAHLLAARHEIVVYEAGDYAGGHTNTIRVDTEYETHHVDTGFIVMNDRNYPALHAAARPPRCRAPADAHELLGQGRAGGLRVLRHAAGPLLPAAQPAQPPLPAHDARPAALQPRAAPAAGGRGRGRGRLARRLPRATPLLAPLRRAADRAAGLRRLVGGPAPDAQLPGALPGRVLRQPRHARLPRPAALVDDRRRLGPLRRGAERAVPRSHPPELARALDLPRGRPRHGLAARGAPASASTTS